MCPGDCGDSCDDVAQAIDHFAATAAAGCSTSDECAVLQVAPCDLGTAITCHGLPHRVGADLDPIEKLLTGSVQAGCEHFQCDCQLSEAVCQDGVCVGNMN